MAEPRILEQSPGDVVVGCSGCSWTEHATSHLEGWLRCYAHALGGCLVIKPPPRPPWWRRLVRRPAS